jgi:hypothetical protein
MDTRYMLQIREREEAYPDFWRTLSGHDSLTEACDEMEKRYGRTLRHYRVVDTRDGITVACI